MSKHHFILHFWLVFCWYSCSNTSKNLPTGTSSVDLSIVDKEVQTTFENEALTTSTPDYELHLPEDARQLLVLFPGGGDVGKDIEANFAIVEPAQSHKVAVATMNFNRHLWVTPEDCAAITQQLTSLRKNYGLEHLPIVLGGMSMGGNVAISLANYWQQQKNEFVAQGVFIVDAPLDLYQLYENALYDTKRTNLSEQRLGEPRWIVGHIEQHFGTQNTAKALEKVAPLTYHTLHTNNIAYLKNTPLRFYTEPDPEWWKTNRQTTHERTNAYLLQRWAPLLQQKGWTKVQLLQSQGKGYRANGQRHPHSWSIVDIPELLVWIYQL